MATETCYYCRGEKVCPDCKGKKYVPKGPGQTNHRCEMCFRNVPGKCHRCGGTGKINI